MAIPISFEKLIKNNVVESARIEYKEGLNPEFLVHTISAFANDIDNWGGGYIVIGMKEVDGVIDLENSGLKKMELDSINKEILNKVNLIEPKYIPIVEPVIYKKKHFILIWCPGSNDRPYKCPIHILKDDKKKEYAYYIRKMSSTIKANDKMVKELYELNGDVPFDDRPNNEATIKDLKNNIIDEFLDNVDSDLLENENLSRLDVLKSLRIVSGSKENLNPVNVGLMFFNEHPDNFFRCAQIEVVDKPDETGEGMVEKIFKGPLDKQLRDALMFIQNYIIKEKIHKIPNQAEAVRNFNYPYGAIEEALTNAVYHKSYRTPEPITVVSTPDGLSINSVPGPDRSIKDEDIKNGKMQTLRYRNRRIGDFPKELDMAEGRNTGIPKIFREMQKNHSPKPILKTDEDRSYFSVFLPIHKDFVGLKKLPTKTTPKNYPHQNGNKNGEVTKKEYKNIIIKMIKENKNITKDEIAKKLNITKDEVKYHLKQLVNDGYLKYVGTSKKGYWKLLTNV